MPHYMYIKISTALNKIKKPVNGSKVLFLGVAYKPNINDERESPAPDIMDITAHKGGEVIYYDPYISKVKTSDGREFISEVLTEETMAKADVVVLTTNHKDFDIKFIKENAKLIVDLRNMIEEEDNNTFKL
jgi:UDP-N-acetyl-D-glucosamine dehydrogenase